MHSLRPLAAALCLGLPLAAFAQPDARGIRRDHPAVPFAPLEVDASGSAGLFVGINEFTDDPDLRPLRFAVNDAVALAHLFVVELERVPPEHCYLALSGRPAGEEAERYFAELMSRGCQRLEPVENELLKALVAIRRVSRDEADLLVLSFSTHGFAEDGLAYVMPADGQKDFLRQTALQLTTIEEQAARSAAGHRLLLIDACQERRGGDERALSGLAELGANHRMSPAFQRAIRTPTGQAKLASCDVGEYSWEDPNLKHGVFTHAFLEALRGGASLDDRNLVRLGAVATYVEEGVRGWTEARNRSLPPDEQISQSPSFHGPEAARKLPLAAKGEELAALVTLLARRITRSGPYTEAYHARLAAELARLGVGSQGDRDLLAVTRQFAAGRIQAQLFVPYLDARWRETPAALAPAAPAAMKPRRDPPGPAAARLEAPFDRAEAQAAQRAWAERLGRQVVEEIDLGNGVTLSLTLIPPGTYRMGGGADDPRAKSTGRESEKPQHEVTISQPFYLGTYELTVEQYRAVVGRGVHGDPREAATNLSVADLEAGFLQALSRSVPGSGKFRLPTEAEWEYACRAGTTTAYSVGTELTTAQANIWHDDRSNNPSFDVDTTVGRYAPNAFGLYDMHGNVWEWCGDGPRKYGQDPATDAKGPTAAGAVARGGSYHAGPHGARSSTRAVYDSRSSKYGNFGFRIAREIP